MTRIVSPEEFDQAFRAEDKRFRPEIAVTEMGTPDWTELVLGEAGVLAGVARRLGLQFLKEHRLVDAVMCEKIDSEHFSEGWLAPEQLTIAVEHENYAGGANREMITLARFNSPLKVLITYPSYRGAVTSADACLRRYAEIAYRADVFQDFTTARRHLVILGWALENDLMRWDSYVYRLGNFVPLGGNP